LSDRLKTAARAVCAVLLAFLTVNGLCFFYYSMPGWYERSSDATSAVWQPGGRIVQALEGAGSHTVDENGYVNPKKPLADSDYVLVLGSSHTVGENVSMRDKYTTLLEGMLYGDSDRLHIYNMAQHGHYFPELASGFAAAVSEFPNSSAVVLEITDTKFPMDHLQKGLAERPFDETMLGPQITRTAGTREKVRTAGKTAFPLISLLTGKQFAGSRVSFDNAFGLDWLNKNQNEAEADSAEGQGRGGGENGGSQYDDAGDESYEVVLDRIVKNMRSRYSGRIIFLYHPEVELGQDGTMEIYRDLETWKVFCRVCERYQVEWIDVGDRFLNGYQDRWEVPYGFFNTEPGKGHLNRFGHRVLAEALYDALKGGGES